MPRERQFSEADVVDQLADLFSAHGYGGTSMAMLQAATGLGKQSLYNAFGDKAAMYRQAVDCATARFARVLPAMRQAPSGRAALQRFFQNLAQDCLSQDPAAQACIVTSGLLEDLGDAALHGTLEQKWMATHELLRAQVERGQRDGSITNPLPSAQLADQLMLAVSGLRVMARVTPAIERIDQIISNTLALLDAH
jgi:TetR/AcrR family transcriptional regulator, transcriptional repressor for nem operon